MNMGMMIREDSCYMIEKDKNRRVEVDKMKMSPGES